MAKIVWAEPALSDLDAIADYIALDNPHAARELVRRRSGRRRPNQWMKVGDAFSAAAA